MALAADVQVVVRWHDRGIGNGGRAAPGELDVAVADLERLLGRPATDLRTAGERALT